MKLTQIFNERLDWNDIDSEYLWTVKKDKESGNMQRINLTTLKINSSFAKCLLSHKIITHYIPLPNNTFFGRYIKKDQKMSYLFISDKNFNIKIIKTLEIEDEFTDSFTCCFYDDSIFVFCSKNFAKRYLISQNMWISLPNIRLGLWFPKSCIGFNQKILIISLQKMWVYDIILDSYSENEIQFESNNMIKHEGKIYSLVYDHWSSDNIKFSDNPFSIWKTIYLEKNQFHNSHYVYFKGSVYFLSSWNKMLYQMSLKTYKIKLVKAF